MKGILVDQQTYWRRRVGVNENNTVLPESVGKCRRDDAKPVAEVSALRFLKCFDTDGWVTGTTSNL